MIQCPTTPAPLQHGLSNTAVSSPSITQRSPLPAASAPSRNTFNRASTSEMAMKEISRKALRKFTLYPKPNILESLEQLFMERSLIGHHIGPGDAKVGEHIFLNGIKKLSDNGLQATVLMKHAGRENRCHQALAAAWKLKEAEYYGRLMTEVYVARHKEHKHYREATAEGKDILLEVGKSPDEMKDHVDGVISLSHELYGKQTVSLNTMRTQLQQLEKEGYQDNFEQWFNHSTEPQDPTATVPPTLVDTLGVQEAPPALLFPENVFDLGSFPHEPDDFPAPSFKSTALHLPYVQSDAPNDFPVPPFEPTAPQMQDSSLSHI
ncbi:hypothetical protein SCLCIDRAFT_9514 [Scleroderma citrinum Foug A]|uniref:Uncharacterized protein n=1 Tax=Scleroderma citrinum Foug A TaxID=1036808 RepID=A0A0C3DYA6_9AGAM|nr:hypothetical protein SCLCIDRAFT_9514 [Scleroderma citrinum Foug A]